MTHESEHIDSRRLRLYVEGELSPAESEAVGRHLHDCAHCRVETAELRDVLESLKIEASAAPLRPVWPYVEERLRQGEARRLSLVSALAAAAGLVIALLIGARADPSDSGTWSALGFAVSSDRDIAVVDFASSEPNEGGSSS